MLRTEMNLLLTIDNLNRHQKALKEPIYELVLEQYEPETVLVQKGKPLEIYKKLLEFLPEGKVVKISDVDTYQYPFQKSPLLFKKENDCIYTWSRYCPAWKEADDLEFGIHELEIDEECKLALVHD